MRSILKYKLFLFFFILGFIAFGVYWLTDGQPLCFLLIGPPLYIAAILRSLIPPAVPIKTWMEDWLLLFPFTILYFCLIGVHYYYLRRERSWLRRVGVFVTFLFLAGIHVLAWNHLSAYYVAYR